MPELPEVETVRRGLEKTCVGRIVDSVDVISAKLLKPPVENPVEFAALLSGKRIHNVRRRGKHLILGLDNGYALLAHLKMRGSFRFEEIPPRSDDAYLGVRIRFQGGAELRYHDSWGWGEFRLLRDAPTDIETFVPALAGMGIEPFDEGFTVEALRKAASRRARTSIKAYLLDQASVAGVGNIYADEALFKAGIRPDRVVGDLETDEWQRLRDALVAILTEATEGGGTISDNFFNTEGQPGAYVPRVYGRGGMPCVDCGTLLTRVKITGRGTVYCPKCQTTGRGQ